MGGRARLKGPAAAPVVGARTVRTRPTTGKVPPLLVGHSDVLGGGTWRLNASQEIEVGVSWCWQLLQNWGPASG